jgi:hypothetical protein
MPAGLNEAIATIVASSFESIDDPKWEHDPHHVAWRHFTHDAYAEGNIADGFNFIGYSNRSVVGEVLRRWGDDLTREFDESCHPSGTCTNAEPPAGQFSQHQPNRLRSDETNALVAIRPEAMGAIHRRH